MTRRAPTVRADACRDALEAFNRATHGDALPEMQLVPAEYVQRNLPLAGYRPSWRLPAAFAVFFFILTVVGAHTL